MSLRSRTQKAKKFGTPTTPAISTPKAPSPRATGGTPTAPSSTTTPTKPTTTRRVITQQEAGQIAQETFRTQVQVLTQPIRNTINSLTNLAEQFKSAGYGRTPDSGARQNYLLTLEKIEKEEKKIIKIEEEQHNIVLQNNVNQIIQAIESGQVLAPDYFQNNITWVKTGAITQQQFLDSYYSLSNQGIIHSAPTEIEEVIEPVIEPVIEEVIELPEILPEVIAEPDSSITDNMVTQQVINFNIVNGRAVGSIKFVATNNFNPYYS